MSDERKHLSSEEADKLTTEMMRTAIKEAGGRSGTVLAICFFDEGMALKGTLKQNEEMAFFLTKALYEITGETLNRRYEENRQLSNATSSSEIH